MGCWGLFVFAVSGAIYACKLQRKYFHFINYSILVCLERWLAERISLKVLYFIGYFAYVIGCTVNFFVHHVAVNIAMCFTCKFCFLIFNLINYYL